MDISIIGTGYVGLVSGAGFAEKGNNVICVDIIKEKVDLINSGKSPIYEKGLDDAIGRNVGKHLKATTDLESALMNSDITFICVGTPSGNDGRISLRQIKVVAEQCGKALAKKNSYHVFVVKSTVVPGTTENVVAPIIEKNSGKKVGKHFGIGMNPEFLREGLAMEDFMKPDRVVIGSKDEKSGSRIGKTYRNFDAKILMTDIKTAEMTKYASNLFLATKISFINELGNICKRLGIDVYDVAKGMAFDHRISRHFLKAGTGYGGSCFPKDLAALIAKAEEVDYEPLLLKAVRDVNKRQPMLLLDLARKKVGKFGGKKVCVLGLAFKPETDDMRDSPAIPIVKKLLDENAIVSAYDPQAMKNAKAILGDKVEYGASASDALKDADVAIIVTDWKKFKKLDFNGMKTKIVIDGRKTLENKDGIDYEGICW